MTPEDPIMGPGVLVNVPCFLLIKAHPLFHRFGVGWAYTYGTPQKWSKKRGFDVQLWFWHFRFFWRPFGGPRKSDHSAGIKP